VSAVYAFASGPGVWLAFGLFLAGLVIQGLRFYKSTRSRELRLLPPAPAAEAPAKAPPKGGGKLPLFERLLNLADAAGQPLDRILEKTCRTVLVTQPFMTALTVTFHVLLFATPLFLLAHNVLLAESVGFHLPHVPDGMADVMTALFLLCGAAFLFRRMFVGRVRAITTGYDYFIFLVTLLPFATGFLAYHQIGDYGTMIVLHVLSGELMLVLIPFTRLGHALFFFLYRFLLPGEYSFGQGRRAF
jgi:nitrate reductase gamma subunit